MTRDGAKGAIHPYRGLEPFDEADAAYFFGRERETRLITASLFASPLTLLYGASGVGKSSVLRAGVLPRLRERADLLPVIFPLISREGGTTSEVRRGWQTDPVSGVKETVALALFESAADDPKVLRRYRDEVLRHDMSPLQEFIDACSRISRRRLMVILDQFEEYSLYHPEDDLFAEQFPRAVVPGSRTVSFLISLREDALAKLDRFKGRMPTLWDSYRRVDHLERHAAEDAIRLPLGEYNRRRQPDTPAMAIEPELVAAVLRDVQTESVQFAETGSGTLDAGSSAGGRIETPYLQLVMTRLWEREVAEGSTTLRLGTLLSEGGAAEIVRTHLDRVMQQFTPEEQDMAARVFHRLVTPTGAKIAFSVRDLAEYESIDASQLAPILRRLEEGSRRILRRVAIRYDTANEPRYEIFHDRLGKAILAWRSKRLAEHAREESKRQEAEQKQIANEARSRLGGLIEQVMDKLGKQGQALWAKVMFYMVSTDGRRTEQSASELAALSDQPADALELMLRSLTDGGVLRLGFRTLDAGEARYQVVHDTMAQALLEWHSQYVLGLTRRSRGITADRPGLPADLSGAAELERSVFLPRFPYARARDLLRKGRVIPFLGAGVSLSSRPQDVTTMQDRTPFAPSNRELKEWLAKESGFPASEFETSDLAEVASYFAQVSGRPRLDGLLAQALGNGELRPSETHRFLAEAARTSPLVILTTNYDRLMEQALSEAEVAHDVIAYLPLREGYGEKLAVLSHETSEVTFSDPHLINVSGTTVVVRLHGPLILPQRTIGSYVVTEEDQIEWVSRASSFSTIPAGVQQALTNSILLSLGHSARDWSQRALLNALTQKRKPYAFATEAWAVALRPARLSVITWQRYDVTPFDLDLNEWATSMREERP
jgi:hypothetical protein